MAAASASSWLRPPLPGGTPVWLDRVTVVSPPRTRQAGGARGWPEAIISLASAATTRAIFLGLAFDKGAEQEAVVAERLGPAYGSHGGDTVVAHDDDLVAGEHRVAELRGVGERAGEAGLQVAHNGRRQAIGQVVLGDDTPGIGPGGRVGDSRDRWR